MFTSVNRKSHNAIVTMSLLLNNAFFELTLLALILITTFYLYLTRNFNYWKNRNIPYIKPLPLFGNFKEQFLFKKNLGCILLDIYNRARDGFIGIFVTDEPFLLVTNVELVRAILVKDFHNFEDRTVAVSAKDDSVSGNILLMMKNPEWKVMRHKLSPFFSSGKLKQMMYLMSEVGVRLRDYLEIQVRRNEVIDVREVLENYATEVISSCAFGINSQSFDNEEDEFKKAGKKIFDWDDKFRAFSLMSHFLMPGLARLLKLKFVDPSSAKFLKAIFFKTLTEREQNKTVRNDLLDLLIKLKNEDKGEDGIKWGKKFALKLLVADFVFFLEGDVLLAQAIQFFMAGFETSGSTVGFTLFELAWHPEIQDRLRNEVKDAVERHGNCGYEAIKEMTYLDMVIKGMDLKLLVRYLSCFIVRNFAKISDSSVFGSLL